MLNEPSPPPQDRLSLVDAALHKLAGTLCSGQWSAVESAAHWHWRGLQMPRLIR
jgi:hypothetical protein